MLLLPLVLALAVAQVDPQQAQSQQFPDGSPVTIQQGAFTDPLTGLRGFEISRNCFPLTPPGQQQQCDLENFLYSASLFTPFVFGSQAIKLTSFNFFMAVGFPNVNIYDVYMGIGNGPLSLFGRFGLGVTCDGSDPTCGGDPQCVSGYPCYPHGASGTGSYLYDPTLGDLHIQMVEKIDEAAGTIGDKWYNVTQFHGNVVATPEPSTLVMMGSGLAVLLLAAMARRRRHV